MIFVKIVISRLKAFCCGFMWIAIWQKISAKKDQGGKNGQKCHFWPKLPHFTAVVEIADFQSKTVPLENFPKISKVSRKCWVKIHKK